MNDLGMVFNNIYKNHVWSGVHQTDGDGSGIGSEPSKTVVLQEELIRILKSKSCTSILDSPCGACKWTRDFILKCTSDIPNFRYYGVDISEIAVERAKASLSCFEPGTVRLETGNMCDMSLPGGYQVILCRDALQHLEHDNIIKAVRNFAKTSGVEWIILGGYPNGVNKNIRDGDYFDFNPAAAPFSWKPEMLVDEMHPEYTQAPKHLFVYSVGYFKALFDLI